MSTSSLYTIAMHPMLCALVRPFTGLRLLNCRSHAGIHAQAQTSCRSATLLQSLSSSALPDCAKAHVRLFRA